MNGDLANDLGNLFARATAMIEKYCGGTVPRGLPAGSAEKALIDWAHETVDLYRKEMKGLSFHLALKSVWEYINKLNRYIVSSEPWGHGQGPPAQAGVGPGHAQPGLRAGTGGLHDLAGDAGHGRGDAQAPGNLPEHRPPGAGLHPEFRGGPQGLESDQGPGPFPRIDPKQLEPQKPETKKAVFKKEPIEFDEFLKVDIRVGRIVECDQPKGSKKLLRCLIDLGEAKPRQILTGLAEAYKPEEMKDQSVLVVVNLKPRQMMGLESPRHDPDRRVQEGTPVAQGAQERRARGRDKVARYFS